MWLSIVIPILLSVLVIVCVLLTLVVLMQRPKNEGLGAAFGSSMTENIFGAQTATVLTKATVYLGCIFFGVTLLLTVLTARQSMERRVGVLESEVRKAAVVPTPAATVSPGFQFASSLSHRGRLSGHHDFCHSCDSPLPWPRLRLLQLALSLLRHLPARLPLLRLPRLNPRLPPPLLWSRLLQHLPPLRSTRAQPIIPH